MPNTKKSSYLLYARKCLRDICGKKPCNVDILSKKLSVTEELSVMHKM